MADPRITKLIAARQQASRDKHARTLQALDRLVDSGTPITFAAVAREAGVSTWLVYNKTELKQAITDAMNCHAQQANPRRSPVPAQASAASLRTDLELARHEIAALRRSELKLRDRLRRTLGAEIEQIDRTELVARISDLETTLANLRTDNNTLVEANHQLSQLVAQQRDELDTANTLLRRYMKEASRT